MRKITRQTPKIKTESGKKNTKTQKHKHKCENKCDNKSKTNAKQGPMKSNPCMQNLCEIETYLVSLLANQGPYSEIEIRMRVTDQELEKAIGCLMSRVMSMWP